MDKKMINQKEYLKKYLSSGKDKKKIKKKKPKIGSQTVTIIDDDIDLKNMRAIEDGEFDIYNNTEDGPQIAGIVDERGPVDFSDKKRWKIITDDIDGDITVTSIDRNEKISEATSQSSRIPASNPRNRSPSDDGKGRPPLRQRNDSDQEEPGRKTLSSKKRRQCSVSNPNEKPPALEDIDFSPPRRVEKNDDLEESSRRRKSFKKKQRRAVSSPARNSSGSENSDISPPRRARKNSDSDETRCKKSSKKKPRVENLSNSEDSDCSPPRRVQRNSNLDEYSHRKSTKKRRSAVSPNSEDNDLSVPRRVRKVSDSDLSPPRHSKAERLDSSSKHSKTHENSFRSSRHDKYDNRTSKASPSVGFDSSRSRGKDDYKLEKRRNRSNSLEHERSNRQSRKDRTKLTSRRRKEGDKERSLSPRDRQRNSKKRGANKHSRKDEDDSTPDLSPPREAQTNLEDLDPESKPLQNTTKNYQEMSEETTGFGQAPIFRDRKTGRKRDFAAERRDKEAKDEKRKELEDKYAQWGRGLKQVEDHKEKLDRDLYEMSKPLARYADDADLERELKAQEREGDPMLAYIKRKQIKEGKQEPEKPKYQGPFMPNRFGIRPGYRWDGVDRSNGYEKKWFDAQNARKAVQEEAYKWSTADM
ncbi:BUD13 homolog [Diprion similis]|uniref:BUD13 homolog n=1 Tax=Diprion similis TaxID=362088 RepID=UPI001EF8BE7E|nr:BUD13 homolog [Diprion similis]